MNIKDYEYIVSIANQGGITKASEQLFISQPALTKFLQRIEDEIGMSLFVRNGKQFIPTEAGQKYIEAGREILRLDQDLAVQLRYDKIKQFKRIRIGYPVGRSSGLLHNILHRFVALYPDINIYTSVASSRHLFEALQNRNLDLAVIMNVEQHVGYTYQPIGTSYLSIASASTNPLVSTAIKEDGYPYPVVDTSSLNQQKFIMVHENTNSGRLIRELFRRYDIHPNIIMNVDDVRSIIDAVRYGIGISAFMSVPLDTREISYLSFRNIKPIKQIVYLVYRSDLALSEPLKTLISMICELSR
ncbi:LysR family transcriptional regulator [Oribacterium sp. HCP28S3_H8]|uniref:LysR family transcriptional regulator n=1 Tax=Oribacterium sp. HCP28S3_H8 TaxID=3438945 RepID=UPI003F8C95A2